MQGAKEREIKLQGDRVVQVYYPTKRRWGGHKERRFLLLGPRPAGGIRPTEASGDIVDDVVLLDDANVIDASLVQQIERAVTAQT